MKKLFIAAFILLAFQFLRVECDQSLGNIIANKDLYSIDHRNSLVGGLNAGGGFKSSQVMYKIWIRGTSWGEYNAVSNSISNAGCWIVGSNFNDQYRGVPMWGYVVARLRCSVQSQWTNLVYDWNFYARVAFTERQFLTFSPPEEMGQLDLSKKKRELENLVQGDINEPTGYNFPRIERAPTWNYSPSEEDLEHVRSTLEEEAKLKYNIQSYLDELNKENITAERIEQLNKRRYYCEIRPEEYKRLSTECDNYYPPPPSYDPPYEPPSPPPYYPPPPPYYPPSSPPSTPPPPYYPPSSPPYHRPYDCYNNAIVRNMIRKLTGNETDEEREAHEKRLLDICPINYQDQPDPPSDPIWPPIMIPGFEQVEASFSLPKTNNWNAIEGRNWLNYLEVLGWSHQSEISYQNIGAKFFVLDTGVNEYHAEFSGKSAQLLKLPNMIRGNAYDTLTGFVDQSVLDYFRESAYWEDYSSHGTAITALIIGNTVGLARTATVYYAKVLAGDYADIQGIEEAYRSVAQFIEEGHVNRPAIVTTSLMYLFSENECYTERINNNQPHCAQGIVDAIQYLHSIGVATVLPAGNGANYYDLLYDFNTGAKFPDTGIWHGSCGIEEPINAVSVDICATSQWRNNPWDMFYPIHGMKYLPGVQKPFIITASDSEQNKMRKWRNIQYGYGEDASKPWYSVGSPNNGACVDYVAPGIYMTQLVANAYAREESHYFTSGYKTYPYLESGTSYATPMVAVVMMHAMTRYQPHQIGLSYNSDYVEWLRVKVAQNSFSINGDVDICRNNNWNQVGDTNYPRVRIFY